MKKIINLLLVILLGSSLNAMIPQSVALRSMQSRHEYAQRKLGEKQQEVGALRTNLSDTQANLRKAQQNEKQITGTVNEVKAVIGADTSKTAVIVRSILDMPEPEAVTSKQQQGFFSKIWNGTKTVGRGALWVSTLPAEALIYDIQLLGKAGRKLLDNKGKSLITLAAIYAGIQAGYLNKESLPESIQSVMNSGYMDWLNQTEWFKALHDGILNTIYNHSIGTGPQCPIDYCFLEKEIQLFGEQAIEEQVVETATPWYSWLLKTDGLFGTGWKPLAWLRN